MLRPRFQLAPLALTAALATNFVMSSGAWAQSGPARATVAINLSIPSQPLMQALNELARQARLELIAAPDLVAGKTAPAVSGALTARQALDRLLVGSDLVADIEGSNVFVKRASEASTSNSTLAPITVTAQAERGDATEGTGSYAASRVSLGKDQTIRETPQSITVVTRQRIEDQGLNSLGEVMQQATGVTLKSDGLGGDADGFYSRGFQIGSIQIDGSAVDAPNQRYFSNNLAMYDSVQVVRGADGLFAGTGEPGGSVNLVRKRPLATPQILVLGALGSWNQRRTELDVTGPLAQDGRVRGRAVIAHEDREFYYDVADARKTLLYGIVEADLSADTKVTIGGSYEKAADHPWGAGLPRATSGADLHLPRSTALMANWNEYNRTNQELFAQLDQGLNGDWRIKAQANYIKLRSDIMMADGTGAVDPATGTGSRLGDSRFDQGAIKKTFDVNVSGTFAWLGRRHNLLIGADWQDTKREQHGFNLEFDTPLSGINVRGFDPASVPYPRSEWKYYSSPGYGSVQKGLYSRLKLSLTDRLTAIAGARYASYDFKSPSIYFDRGGNVTRTATTAYKESGILTPYGGLVYDIDDRWTAYGSISEIHKSQTNRLQGPLPGTPLDAITGRNYELGAKGEFNEGRLTASMALYRIERNGEGVRDPSHPSTGVGDVGLNCCWLDQGKVTSQGLDAEISGELARGWQVFAGYTYNSNRNKATNSAYHSATPRHMFRLWNTYRLPGELSVWTLGGGVNLQSAHFVSGTARAYNPTTGAFDGASSPFKFSQAGYAVWSASVQYRFHRNWTAVLNLNNLFDKTYYKNVASSSGYNWYGEPRNVMLTLRGTF